MNWLLSVDRYSKKPPMLYKGAKGHRTVYGALMSILIAFLYIGCLVFIFVTFFDRDHPEVNIERLSDHDPKGFVITNDSFTMAFGLQNSNAVHFVDPEIYTVRARHTIVLKKMVNESLVATKTSRDVPLIACSEAGLDTALFARLDLKSMYCLSDIKDLKISGDFESIEFGSLDLNFIRCRGSSCKDSSQVDAALSRGYFGMNYVSKVPRASNPQNPIEPTSGSYFTTTSRTFAKYLEIRMSTNEIQTRNPYIGYIGPDVEKYVTIDNFKPEITMIATANQTMPDTFLNIKIRMEPVHNVVTRRYKTAMQFLAEFGGLAEVIALLGIILTFSASRTFMYLDLAQEVFKREMLLKNIFDVARKDKNSVERDEFNDYSQSINSPNIGRPVIMVSPSMFSGSGKNQKLVGPKNRTQPKKIVKPNIGLRRQRQSFSENSGRQSPHPTLFLLGDQKPKLLQNTNLELVKQIQSSAGDDSFEPESSRKFSSEIPGDQTPYFGPDSSIKNPPSLPDPLGLRRTLSTRPTHNDVLKLGRLLRPRGIVVLFYSFFPCLRKVTSIDPVVNTIKTTILTQFDYSRFLAMAGDVDKLKSLIFNEEQRLLFDVIPPADPSWYNLPEEAFRKKQLKVQQVFKSMQSNTYKSQIDENIVSCLEDSQKG